MTALKCDGDCESYVGGEHIGEVQVVNVQGWGQFYYCESAIKEDIRRGLIVTVVDQELNKEQNVHD